MRPLRQLLITGGSPPTLPCARSGFSDRIPPNGSAKCACHTSAWMRRTDIFWKQSGTLGRGAFRWGGPLHIPSAYESSLGCTNPISANPLGLLVRGSWRVDLKFKALTTPWRNGSASDSSPEGCAFKSRRGHLFFIFSTYSSLLGSL